MSTRRAWHLPILDGPSFESMTLEALKQAIAELPEEEKSALAAWLNEQEMDQWDRQMRGDFCRVAGGQASWNSEGGNSRWQVQADG